MKYYTGFVFHKIIAGELVSLEVRRALPSLPGVETNYRCVPYRATAYDQRRFDVSESQIDAALLAWNRKERTAMFSGGGEALTADDE